MSTPISSTSEAASSANDRARGAGGGCPNEAEAAGPEAFVRDLRAVPNVLSIARVVFVYVSITLIWYSSHVRLGLGVGVLAGLSDYLDGYLARKMGKSTRIGGLLDQAADLLVLTACVFMFVHDGTWPVLLLLVVLLRETLVMNLRLSAAEMGFSLPSIFLGKWSSNWMFYSLAVMGVVRGRFFPAPYDGYLTILSHFAMFVGVVSSMITAGIYLRRYAVRYVPATPRSFEASPESRGRASRRTPPM